MSVVRDSGHNGATVSPDSRRALLTAKLRIAAFVGGTWKVLIYCSLTGEWCLPRLLLPANHSAQDVWTELEDLHCLTNLHTPAEGALLGNNKNDADLIWTVVLPAECEIIAQDYVGFRWFALKGLAAQLDLAPDVEPCSYFSSLDSIREGLAPLR